MRLTAKKILLSAMIILTVLIIVPAYLFLWGKLFPFSPVIIGFEKHELQYTVVYIQKGATFEDVALIDGLVPAVETFHDLAFTQKPRIFIFRDRAGYERRSVSHARFCAFPQSSIVISPWAIEEAAAGEISLETYLTHELSHTLLYQHMSLFRAYRYPKWLMEGIAVYSADQMGTSWYPDKSETYSLIAGDNFMPPEYFKTGHEDDIELDVPYRATFMYSEFACLVDYLIELRGKNTFLAYLKALLREGDHEQIFVEHYGIGFDDAVTDFREHVRQEVSERK